MHQSSNTLKNKSNTQGVREGWHFRNTCGCWALVTRPHTSYERRVPAASSFRLQIESAPCGALVEPGCYFLTCQSGCHHQRCSVTLSHHELTKRRPCVTRLLRQFIILVTTLVEILWGEGWQIKPQFVPKTPTSSSIIALVLFQTSTFDENYWAMMWMSWSSELLTLCLLSSLDWWGRWI